MRILGIVLGLLSPPYSITAMQLTPNRNPTVHIGIVTDGPWRFGTDPRPVFEREIGELLSSSYEVSFDQECNLEGDWTPEGVAAAVDSALAFHDLDVLIAGGSMASQYVAEIATKSTLRVPVVAPAVLDAGLQGFKMQGGSSGIANFNYLAFPNTIARDLKKFREITPFSHVTILTHENLLPEDPDDRLAQLSAAVGVTVDAVGVGESVDEALAKLGQDVEAVYVFPLANLDKAQFASLAGGLIARKIPSFSFFGGEYIERGLMASLNPEIFERLARRVALNIFDILKGGDASELPVAFQPGERLELNTQTARAVGVYPNWDILVEAETIFDLEERAADRRINLEYAVQEAVVANLSLLAQDRVVARGAWEVKRARANLLPHVDMSATGAIVDHNLAETSFGVQPERSLTASAVLSQILYSEPAHAGYAAEQSLQEARQYDRETLMLDVAEDVAIAYLNVLRTKAVEKIQLENVKLTRSNLDLARVREDLGQSGPAETLRWETQLATNRKNEILASANRRAAEVALNQLLNRPLEETFETVESEFASPDELLKGFKYHRYADNPQLFGILRNFMVAEGLVAAPELKAFDRAVEAQERLHLATKRAYWIPDIALRAGANSNLVQGGAGSSGSGLALPIELPDANDTHWNVGINLTYPLFSGLDKRAARAAASEKLAQLRTERALNRNLVEQRVRTSIELAGGSHGAISQSKKAAQAANQTLELVTDAYARGAVSILDLLDAQNSAFVARSVEATAVYDFLADFMHVSRAIGRFDFLSTDAERAEFEKRMDDYFRAAGVEVPNE